MLSLLLILTKAQCMSDALIEFASAADEFSKRLVPAALLEYSIRADLAAHMHRMRC